jgi:hypothetical protein
VAGPDDGNVRFDGLRYSEKRGASTNGFEADLPSETKRIQPDAHAPARKERPWDSQ